MIRDGQRVCSVSFAVGVEERERVIVRVRVQWNSTPNPDTLEKLLMHRTCLLPHNSIKTNSIATKLAQNDELEQENTSMPARAVIGNFFAQK